MSFHQFTTAKFLLCAFTALLLLSACSGSRKSPNNNQALVRVFSDDAGNNLSVPAHIDRVISLAPNLTEIVYAVGAGDRLVGDTTYCDYPEEAKQVAKVGDTLKPNIERIIALRPQLVLVSTASQLEAFTNQLADHHIAVYVTDPRDLESVFRSMENIGDLLNQNETAKALVSRLRARAQLIEKTVQGRTPVTVFYQVSAEPLYTAGRDSFVTDLIIKAGGKSVTAQVPSAWPRYSAEAALAASPDAIILPTGGSMGNANSTVAKALATSPAVKNGKVYRINDDHLSRPGPRSVDGLEEIARALHPEAFKQ